MVKYRSSRLAKRKRDEFLTKAGLWFLLFNILFFCFAELSKLSFLNIKEVSVEGNKIVKTSEIDFIVKEGLEGRALWKFFPKRNIFIYPKDEIKNKILQRFPRIKEADLNLSKFKNLNVGIIERETFALWCNTKEDCFLVDKEGYLFARSEENLDLFRYYIDLSRLIPSENFISRKPNSPIRQFVLDTEKFKEISSFIDFLNGLNLEPYKFVTNDLGDYEIYFGKESRIVFGENQEIRAVMENLQSVMNLEGFNLEEVDYIDLRFGNKVFYK